MCAFSSSERPPPVPRATATTFGRLGATSSMCTSSPSACSHAATNRAIAASPAPPGTRLGFTESIATRSASSSCNSSTPGRRYRTDAAYACASATTWSNDTPSPRWKASRTCASL